LPFISPAKMDCHLKVKSSVISASFQGMTWRFINRHKQYFTITNRYADPHHFYKTRGGRSTWLWVMTFLTATAVPPFLPG
jgi:hypothetical protein